MTSIKEIPMISVEQKNRFREAAIEVERERDELAAQCCAWRDMAVSLANKYPVDSQTFDHMDELREGDHWKKVLGQRDARMKAEAMTEACRACMTIEIGQRDMAYRHTETDGDGDEVVVGDGINYANKAMGAGHCRERIAELIAKYRKQEEGES